MAGIYGASRIRARGQSLSEGTRTRPSQDPSAVRLDRKCPILATLRIEGESKHRLDEPREVFALGRLLHAPRVRKHQAQAMFVSVVGLKRIQGCVSRSEAPALSSSMPSAGARPLSSSAKPWRLPTGHAPHDTARVRERCGRSRLRGAPSNTPRLGVHKLVVLERSNADLSFR